MNDHLFWANGPSQIDLCPLWREPNGDQWIPSQRPVMWRKCFHCMTSSWTTSGLTCQPLNYIPHREWLQWLLTTSLVKKILLQTVVVKMDHTIWQVQGAVSIRKTVLLGMVIPMLKIRRPTGRLIFNMGIPIPGKTVFYIETGPRWLSFHFIWHISHIHICKQLHSLWASGAIWQHIPGSTFAQVMACCLGPVSI